MVALGPLRHLMRRSGLVVAFRGEAETDRSCSTGKLSDENETFGRGRDFGAVRCHLTGLQRDRRFSS